VIKLLKSKFGVAAFLIFLGGLISAVGALIAAKEAIDDKLAIEKKNEEIITLTKENAKLSKEALDQITGGESWTYLTIGVRTTKGIPNEFGISCNVVGSNPLYDVTIEISELTHKTNLPTNSTELKSIFLKDLGTLTKSLYPDMIGILKLPNDKSRIEYLSRLKMRNGVVNQHLIFVKKENGHWTMATKVYRFKQADNNAFKKEDLYTLIDEDFTDKDNIKWIEF